MATFVLVHGSWAGSVVWRQLAPRLRKAGHEVYAPTLTGIGASKHLLSREIDLDTHIQDVIGVVEDEDLSDIVLVGHSYGGMVISGVADRVPEKWPRSSILMPSCRRTDNPVSACPCPTGVLLPCRARTGLRRYLEKDMDGRPSPAMTMGEPSLRQLKQLFRNTSLVLLSRKTARSA